MSRGSTSAEERLSACPFLRCQKDTTALLDSMRPCPLILVYGVFSGRAPAVQGRGGRNGRGEELNDASFTMMRVVGRVFGTEGSATAGSAEARLILLSYRV